MFVLADQFTVLLLLLLYLYINAVGARDELGDLILQYFYQTNRTCMHR